MKDVHKLTFRSSRTGRRWCDAVCAPGPTTHSQRAQEARTTRKRSKCSLVLNAASSFLRFALLFPLQSHVHSTSLSLIANRDFCTLLIIPPKRVSRDIVLEKSLDPRAILNGTDDTKTRFLQSTLERSESRTRLAWKFALRHDETFPRRSGGPNCRTEWNLVLQDSRIAPRNCPSGRGNVAAGKGALSHEKRMPLYDWALSESFFLRLCESCVYGGLYDPCTCPGMHLKGSVLYKHSFKEGAGYSFFNRTIFLEGKTSNL